MKDFFIFGLNIVARNSEVALRVIASAFFSLTPKLIKCLFELDWIP